MKDDMVPRAFNLGSINMDMVIQLERFPEAGETAIGRMTVEALGGKGLNASVAIHLAGGEVRHIGAVNKDDSSVLSAIASLGLSTDYIEQAEQPTGQAVVMLDASSENRIVVCPGANHSISDDHISAALSEARTGDWLVMQNETKGQAHAIQVAKERNMKVAMVAAPFVADDVLPLLDNIDLIALNETEAQQLQSACGLELNNLPVEHILMTLGSRGATHVTESKSTSVAAHVVTAVDTTAAGDTFFGYFLASFMQGRPIADSLALANSAAALAVQRNGAVSSIPTFSEAEAGIKAQTT